MDRRWSAIGWRPVTVAGAVALGGLLLLGPALLRVAFAQDVPDPGPPAGGGVDMGPLLGGLSGLRDAIGGAIRDGIRQLLDALLYTLGLIPRLGVMAFLMAIGVFARALIEGFGLTELGSILIQVPLGPLQEGWVQVLVLDTKGVAFLLLPVAFGIRAFSWNVGLSREDLGELLRDLVVAAVLIATIDGWAIMVIQTLNALTAGLAGGSANLPGAADAAQMAQQATLPLSFAPFPEHGDVQAAIQQQADIFAVWSEQVAAAGLLSLIWAVVGLAAIGAAILRDLVVVLLFILAPLTPIGLVVPWGTGLLRAWWAVFLGVVGIQLVPAVLLRAGTMALLSGILPSQAGTSSLWSVFVGMVAVFGSALFLWRGAMGGARVTIGTMRTARQTVSASRAVIVTAAPVAAKVAAPVLLAAGRAPMIGATVQRFLPMAPPPRPPPPGPRCRPGGGRNRHRWRVRSESQRRSESEGACQQWKRSSPESRTARSA